jgi:hypothetical protein
MTRKKAVHVQMQSFWIFYLWLVRDWLNAQMRDFGILRDGYSFRSYPRKAGMRHGKKSRS